MPTLGDSVLQVALWGVKDPTTLRWIDPPPADHWESAVAMLTQLGALDNEHHSTPLGRTLGPLPVPGRGWEQCCSWPPA